MTNTELKTRESIFEMRKDSIKEHLDSLIKKSERQTEELKMLRKRMNEEKLNLISSLELATEFIENRNWNLSRGIDLTYQFLMAKAYLEEEKNKEGDLK